MWNGEDAQSCEDTHDDRHHRLHIVVHTHHRRTQDALAHHGKEVTEERAEDHDIEHLRPRLRGDGIDRQQRHMAAREGQDEDARPREHPFVHCHYIIFADERIVKREVQGERQLGTHTHQVAPDITGLAAAVCTREDEGDSSDAADEHAADLHPRQWLAEDKERQDHGKDRHGGRHDARVDR